MCDFEPVRTAEENEAIIAQLEQVANMPINTIISLFAAGYRLQPTKESLAAYSESLINDELNKVKPLTITSCDNCQFLGECLSKGQVINIMTGTNILPHYTPGVNANCKTGNKPKFEWKDIVKFKKDGKVVYSFEESEISGEMDDPNTYRIDEFIDFVADKYGVNSDDISVWSIDHFNFDNILLDEKLTLMLKTYSCGCYINETPEWMLEY